MMFPSVKRFDFHQCGHGNRRDSDARPEYLLCGMDFDHHEVWFHQGGDEFIRTRCVFDAMIDHEFMEGFGTLDGCQIALEFARARDMARNKEKAAKE